MSVQHASQGVVKKDLQLYYNREYNGSFLGEATMNFFSIPVTTSDWGTHTSVGTSTSSGVPDLIVSGNKQVYYTPEYHTLTATSAWQAEVNRWLFYTKGATSYVPNGAYNFSFYARSLSGNTVLQYSFYGITPRSTATLTTKWQRFNGTFTINNGPLTLLEFGNLNAGSMVCQIACIQVEAKSYATPFTVPVLWTPNLVNVTSTSGHTKITRGATNNNDWTQARIFSSEGISGPCYVSFKASQTGCPIMVGLNSNPSTGINYTNLDYAWYPTWDAGNPSYIYENGTPYGAYDAYTTSTIFEIIYDGVNVKYYLNGVLKYTSLIAPTLPLYLDSSFFSTANGGSIDSLSFGPLSQINRFSNYKIGGGGLLDISGNNVNADLTNVGFGSSGFTFNGSTQFINLGTSKTSLNISADLTVEAMIKLTSSFTNNPTIVGNGYYDEVFPYKLQFEYNSNNGNLGLFRNDGTNYRYTSWNFGSQSTYFLNKYAHVVATYNSSANTVAIYYNGVSQTVTQVNSGTVGINNTTNFVIGAQVKTNGVVADPFPGEINFVRVYNRALTAAEVSQNFNATRKTYGI